MELNTKRSSLKRLKVNISSYTMIFALVSIWLILTIATKGIFISPRNLSMLVRQTSIVAVLSLGMSFVIISGNTDLSVGSTLGLCGGVAAVLQVWLDSSAIVAVLATIGVGCVLGAWNGFWIAYRKIPAFIVTLGGFMGFQGILLGLTKSMTIAPMKPGFVVIGQGYLPRVVGYAVAVLGAAFAVISIIRSRRSKIKYGLDAPSLISTIIKCIGFAALIFVFVIVMDNYSGIPVPVMIVLVLSLLLSIVATRTRYGRSIYAIGSNKEAAQLAGINDKRVIFVMYIVMGALAATAGIIYTARMNAGTASAGNMMQMDAIAACVIGGVSMSGGIGNLPGALVGALVIASLDNGMSLLNTEYFWQYIVKGGILIIAVWVDTINKSKSK